MAKYVLNAWYAAAASHEVRGALLARTLLEEALVLFRTEDGTARALLDRCTHRFAPLSQGRLCADRVVCPYHGMEYDGTGACTRIPGQDRIPVRASVRSFPVLERYGLVFVWMGDPALADSSPLIDIPQYGSPGWGISRGYSVFGCNWRLITDNLVDPAHTTFVHKRTIGNDAGADVPLQSELVGAQTVSCGRWIDNSDPVPIVKRFADPAGNVDRWQFYYVTAPSTCWVDFGCLPAGTPHTAEEQERAPYRVISYAFLTPIDAGSTHYFSFQLRNVAVQDLAVTQEFERLYHATFEEDRVLLEQIHRAQEAHPELTPMYIASDSGVARLRRLVDEQLKAG
jgi:phenylpropionate dioxygenase-like ring-hydroxylating dioxygenase large terminal subunit